MHRWVERCRDACGQLWVECGNETRSRAQRGRARSGRFPSRLSNWANDSIAYGGLVEDDRRMRRVRLELLPQCVDRRCKSFSARSSSSRHCRSPSPSCSFSSAGSGFQASRPGRAATKRRPTGAAEVFLCSLYDGTATLRTRAALPGCCRAVVDHASSVETVVVDRFSTRHTAPPRENGISGRGGRKVVVLSRAALPSLIVPRRCRLILQCAALATNAAMSLDSSLRDCGSL